MIRFRIGGQELELPKDIDLSFTFENQLFAFDNIQISRTASFNIPRTKSNDLIFGFSHRPDFYGDFVRSKYDAELWYDGGILYGKLAVTDYADGQYSATFLYGNLLKLKEIKEKGNLEGFLPYDVFVEYSDDWVMGDFADWDTYWFDLYDYQNSIPDGEKFNRNANENVNILPTIQLKQLMSDCAYIFGISITFPHLDYFEALAIKLGNKKRLQTFVETPVSCTDVRFSSPAPINVSTDYFDFGTLNFRSMGFIFDKITKVKCLVAKRDLTIKFNSEIPSVSMVGGDGFYFYANSNDRPKFQNIKAGTVELKKGEKFTFITNYPGGGGRNWDVLHNYWTLNSYVFSGEVSVSFDVVLENGNVEWGDKYYLQPNLPKITFIDLLKIYASLTATGIIFNETAQSIEFFDYNFDKTSQKDFTAKIVKLEQVQRQIGDYAQRNKIICKPSDYVDTPFEMDYRVINDNLEAEKELYSIPFNEGNLIDNGEAFIQDFTKKVEGVNTTYEQTDTNDAIVMHIDNDDYLERIKPIFETAYAPEKNYLQEILDKSTTVTYSVYMKLFEFLQLKEKDVIRLNEVEYCIFSATWQKNVAKLVLLKI